MRVLLAPPLRSQVQQLADEAAPRECCGLLVGAREEGVLRVTSLYPARNLAVETDRFEIAPQDHFAAQRSARANGFAVIGCYHSHPGGAAQPSATDLAGAVQDGFLWLIANGEELNAFVYCDGVFRGCVTGAD
ncbi:MAG: peptidase [Alphaproteobacteria bacterium]|jgi:proteasome lid subunit RPN8/RPN11|nr:peptidase [Alphaproteobacteria bacterium]MDB5739918.1 peptidase [Alphaproteobacteria bacterium]